jgi:hypothetical protein
MTCGIILAGGRATRLGPLTAQLNKSLVSVGQRPMIVNHLELLRRAGVTKTVIVTSLASKEQVEGVVSRSHANMEMDVIFAVQNQPLGPAHAIMVGTEWIAMTGPVYVLMADTFIDEPLPVIGETGGWVGVAPATSTRSWCYPDDETESYLEGEAKTGTLVCIGAYGFPDAHKLYDAASEAQMDTHTAEAPMAPLLNVMDIDCNEVFDSWLDVGDVRALTAARQQRFITRDFNRLELSDGVLMKHGDGDKLQPEIRYFNHLFPTAKLLFPRFMGDTRDGGYMMEYVDLPSLAELYLYWPGPPEMWAGIVEDVLGRISRGLWHKPFTAPDLGVAWHNEMYSNKVWERLKEYEAAGNEIEWPVVAKLGEYLAHNLPTTFVRGHGDLNFGNILYGLGSGVIKLVDPRGDVYVDIDYELAKLRYSYRDGFSAICHNLFEINNGEVHLGPDRVAESEAIDRVLSSFSGLRRVTAVEATILLSATPLHNPEQGLALYRQGIKLAQEALSDYVWPSKSRTRENE